jgi:hypothetical protein
VVLPAQMSRQPGVRCQHRGACFEGLSGRRYL